MGKQGQSGNLAQLMLPHLDAAYNLARWLVCDPSIAEDVVQDAYERACRHSAASRDRSGRAWLLQIVRNVAYSKLSAERWGTEVSLGSATRAADGDVLHIDMPDPNPSPEATPRQRQDLAALDDALSALPVAWRECLILREVEALSYEEMARIMDVPIGTVRSRLAHARQALRRGAFGEDRRLGSKNRMPVGSELAGPRTTDPPLPAGPERAAGINPRP